jgi:hypothetical protein
MIRATMFQTTMEIHFGEPFVPGEYAGFRDEVPAANRTWNPIKKLWVVSQPELFKGLPYIKAALEERRMQPELFQSDIGN